MELAFQAVLRQFEASLQSSLLALQDVSEDLAAEIHIPPNGQVILRGIQVRILLTRVSGFVSVPEENSPEPAPVRRRERRGSCDSPKQARASSTPSLPRPIAR